MTARVAPTAALPNAAASSSTSLKFSGALSPRPPLTITGASPRSGLPVSPVISSVTFTRVAEGSPAGSIVSTRPAFAYSCGVNAPGRTDRIAGVPAIETVAITFPVFMGCLTTMVSPTVSMAITSEATGRPTLAAARGATSFPCADAENTAARYPSPSRAAAVAAAASGLSGANPGCSHTSTTSAPCAPSFPAAAPIPGGPTRSACTSPPIASAMTRAAVTASSATLRSAPSRVSANASTFAIRAPSLRVAGA